jgi:hypothetical protein
LELSRRPVRAKRWRDFLCPECYWRFWARSCLPGSTISSRLPDGGIILRGPDCGVIASVWIAPALMAKGMGWTLALPAPRVRLSLSGFFSPPFTAWWRMLGISVIRLLGRAAAYRDLHAISPMYRHNPARR